MKRMNMLLVFLMLIAVLTGCHEHTWTAATCTAPETCSECGETQGEALGHDWLPATCTEPETCSRCGETRGEALGHEIGDWEIGKEATFAEDGTQVKRCARCQEIMEEQPYSIPIFNDGKYICSANDLAIRIKAKLDEQLPNCTIDTIADADSIALEIKRNEKMICSISFPENDTNVLPDKPLNTPFISVLPFSGDSLDDEKIKSAIILACDPTLNAENAAAILNDCKSSVEIISKNDLSYFDEYISVGSGPAGDIKMNIFYLGDEISLKSFIEEKSKLPYFDMSFSDFLSKHSETYQNEGWEIRKVDTGYSYYLGDQMIGIIFAIDQNEKNDPDTITSYGTGRNEDFNLIMLRIIDKSSSEINPELLAVSVVAGSSLVKPLNSDYSDSDFMTQKQIVENTDNRVKMEYVCGNMKYTVAARSSTLLGDQVTYEFTCEIIK